jgi:ubiquinone/menaquinone biosynthesis C-methylase UbiE
MISLPVLRTLLREAVTRERIPRTPEPDLVMDDPDKVAAFTRAGREDGVMAPMYLLHCAQVCHLVRPGDTVVDLGCGPATQLGMIARLNPEARFVGVDFSDQMLGRARAHAAEQGLGNVAFEKSDMADLRAFADDSVDVVYSTVSLHHLPDVAALHRTMAESARILKPDGAIYLADFGRLKSEASVQYFGNQYADRQPELFTLDYIHSLRAAFTTDDYRRGTEQYLAGLARCHATPIAPFLVIVKSPPRAPIDPATRAWLAEFREAMPAWHRTDIADLTGWLRAGGVKTPYLA